MAKYDDMTRDELEAESARLSKEKVAIKAQENEVNGRLDAYRELDRLNIDPARLQQIARVAKMEAKGAGEQEASQ